MLEKNVYYYQSHFLLICLQKLEEKFNANEAQKEQLKTKVKVNTRFNFKEKM